jgi:DNA mismatch repair protein MutS
MSHKIVNEYFDFYTKYTKEYGEKTCVLMQIGSFYEMEMVKNDKEEIGNLDSVAKLLNIQITRKNKSIPIVDRSNPYMAGFPSVSLSKFLPVLLENDFTVIVIDQVSGPPNVKREVVGIYSPSIYPIELISSNESTKLGCITIENKDKRSLIYTLCIIDINTNEIIIHKEIQTDSIIDDIFNVISQYSLRELVVYNISDFVIDNCIFNNILVHIKTEIDKEVFDVYFQNATFIKIFSHIDFGLLSPIEYFQLELNPLSSLNLLMCLDFVSRHSPKCVMHLQPPIIYDNTQHLDLLLNTISQLNVVSNNHKQRGKTSSLINIIDYTLTTIGKRHLFTILTKPFKDPVVIQERYNLTEEIDICKDEIKYILTDITDFVQLHRKMGLLSLSFSEFIQLNNNYLQILKLNNVLEVNKIQKCTISNDIITKLNLYIKEYNDIFDLTESPDTFSFFKKGIFPEIDNLNDKVCNIKNQLEDIRKKYDQIIKGDNFIKINNTETEGYFLTCTKIRGQQLKLKIPQLSLKFTSNTCKITSNEIENISNQLINHTELLNKNISLEYNKQINYLFEKYNFIFNELQFFIEKIDVIYSNNKCKYKYNYVCPTISQDNNEPFFKAKGIRHPIIERVLSDTSYVPNDIALDNKQNGMILYALNSCGKSSLLRSVGLCIIMAQAGLYVPCSEFEYYPFDKLITQVDMNDNLWKSKSSFVSEMIGLRNILSNTNSKTLVLSDELTKGTEVVSATSIFTTAALTLSNQNCKFLFTTHLQDVSKLSCISQNNKIGIYHLSVNIQDDTIFFERKLKKGPCSELYGLEVARAIGLNSQFMKKAFELRSEIVKQKKGIISTKKSRYNSKKLVDFCEICKYTPFSKTDLSLDVHHIYGQCTADENNFINHFHKNAKHNLVTLCKECHQNVHKEHIEIKGYIQSSKGILLDYTIKN